MPSPLRTVMPRIRKSFAERGLVGTLRRSWLLPVHLFREYRRQKTLRRAQQRSDFDELHDMDTDGDFDDWTHLSDLQIPSDNWIYGINYTPIEPDRFAAIFASLQLPFADFVFVDFGSGKGRALLLASELQFKEVLGIEFSPELHAIAQRNILHYKSEHGSVERATGRVKSICMDMVDFVFPTDPCVLFFFDPCAERVLIPVFENLRESLRKNPRSAYVIYVAPKNEQFFKSIGFLSECERNAQHNYIVYKVR